MAETAVLKGREKGSELSPKVSLDLLAKLVAKVRGCERYVELNVAFMTDTHIEEFLIGFKGDVAKSFNVIGEYLEWRHTENIGNILDEDFSAELAVGTIVMHEFSKSGRPVMVWRQRFHLPSPDTTKRMVRWVIYNLEKIKAEGNPKVHLLFDRIGSSMKNVDTSLLWSLLPILQKYYPERLEMCCIYPASWLFWGVWKLTQPLLSDETKNKIKIWTDSEWKKGLVEFIEYDKLHPDYREAIEKRQDSAMEQEEIAAKASGVPA